MADVSAAPVAGKSDKNKLTTLLLCIFLGGLGIHRFYVGKIGTGIVWLLTGGLFGIGWIVDIVMIAVDKFKDKQGNIVS
jgi:TM2 domain-containing membrane protein YozV